MHLTVYIGDLESFHSIMLYHTCWYRYSPVAMDGCHGRLPCMQAGLKQQCSVVSMLQTFADAMGLFIN